MIWATVSSQSCGAAWLPFPECAGLGAVAGPPADTNRCACERQIAVGGWGACGFWSYLSLPLLPFETRRWDEKGLQFSSVQLLSHVRLFATPWIAACQASLSNTNSRVSLKLTSIESVMPSSHLLFCCPLLLLPPIPPSIRVFSNESTFLMRWWTPRTDLL